MISELKFAVAADSTAAAPTDAQLVHDCLSGQEQAWTQLIDRYRNLIFSVPIKYGFSREEAADVFQEVCFDLLSQLKNLREPQAVAKWLLMVASHKCFHRRRREQRIVTMDSADLELHSTALAPEAIELLAEAEEEQRLRQAMKSISARCQQLVKMLFYEETPRPYKDVAQELGIATGSIGFIRQRCLESLRKKMESA